MREDTIDIQWHYFATSHGKGCVDGIGGTVKRQVAERVKQIRAIVIDASSFYRATQLIQSTTNFYFISVEDIEQFFVAELKHIFENAVPVHGISSIHRICVKNGEIDTAAHSLLPAQKPKEIGKKRKGAQCNSAKKIRKDMVKEAR